VNTQLIGIVIQSIALLAVLAAVWQVFLRSKMMHRDIEITFVQRYWQIMDRRSPRFILTGKPRAADEIVILQYVQLCEDEIALRRAGTVSKTTWLFWEDAIRNQLAVPAYARVLAALDRSDYRGVRELLAAESGFDPKATAQ
jgi:hypothetical protein